MTEQEWLEGADIGPMLLYLKQTKASDRKLRLVACACCRRVWRWMRDGRSRAVVEVTEKFIDLDEPTESAIEEMRVASLNACWFENLPTYQQDSLADAAAQCALLGMHPEQVVSEVTLKIFQAVDCDLNELAAQCRILRDIIGNPFRPVVADRAWLTPIVVSLATAIYDEREFNRLPILADASEDAGCDNADILAHCRQGGEHVRGCWCVDLVLGKS